MKNKLKNHGFTLTELLMVTGIITLVIGASLVLISTGSLSVNLTNAQIQTQEQARIAMEQISRELRLSRAGLVRISGNLGWTVSDASPNDTINFQIPLGSYADQLTLNAINEIQWGCGQAGQAHLGHFLAYSVNGNNQLIRSSYTNPDGTGIEETKIICQNINQITFLRNNTSDEYIEIQIVTQKQISAQAGTTQLTQTLHSRVRLRN
jgi:type II secretory pathway pseudopilin PulG